MPPETEDKDIAAVLAQFGRIRQHVRERYPAEYGFHVFSGVRGVHIEIDKDIPANLYIGHFRARIYYEGLKNRCFFCKAEGHIKAECPKLSDIRKQGVAGPANSRLYSQVAASLRIAAGSSRSMDAPPISMTVLQIPKHPNARNTILGELQKSGSLIEAGADAAVREADAAQTVITNQSATTTGNEEHQTMETNDTSQAGKEETGLKRPPASDSSDAEKRNEKGGGKKKKQSSVETKSRSSSSSHDRSRKNSQDSSCDSSRGRPRGRRGISRSDGTLEGTQ